VPPDECRSIASASHVLVVIEAPLSEGIFLPSKFVDYVAVGRPILAVSPGRGAVADFLTEHRGGVAADCTDHEAIAGALRQLYNAWANGTLCTDYPSDGLRSLFCESTVVNQYADVFDRVLSPSSVSSSWGCG